MSIVELPQTIVQFSATNVKRLSAVEIRPNGDLVIIGGRNRQGKSSVLDAIMMAISGGKTIPIQPIHRGRKNAEVTVETQDLIIIRKFTPSGGTLQVKNKKWEGAEIKKPQAVLDTLTNGIAFDPLAFTKMKPREQADVLRKLVGLDVSDLDAKRAEVYESRTTMNKKVSDLSGWLSREDSCEGTPEKEISISDLIADLERIQAKNRDRSEKQRDINDLRAQRAARRKDADRIEEQIANLRDNLTRVNQSIEELTNQIEGSEHELAGMTEYDETELRQQIATVDDTNRKVRSRQAYLAKAEEMAVFKANASELTEELKRIDDEKAKRIAAAKMPVEGLAFDDEGTVTYNEIPFAQASSAEQLRVSVAIAVALNPKLPVMLVREGAMLDKESLSLLGQLAHEAGAQVWVERVTTDDEGAIIIEDGSIAAGDDKCTKKEVHNGESIGNAG